MSAKRSVRNVIIVFVCQLPVLGYSANYYIDSVSGNDDNSGTSSVSAWQSLSKVNSTVFQPGDKILFKSGSVWNGQLTPQGSGTEDKPITIDYYGGSAHPVINGNGLSNDSRLSSTIKLENQDNWVIRNMEITNYGENTDKTSPRAGIAVINTGKAIENIDISNNYVHDVNSNIKGSKLSGGIILYGANIDANGMYVPMPEGDPKGENGALGINNVTVKNNVVENVAIEGIRNYTQIQNQGADGKAVKPGDSPSVFPKNNKNNTFVNNTIKNVAGDGLVIAESSENSRVSGNIVDRFANEKALSSQNYAGLWVMASEGVVVENNAVTNGVYGNNDGTAYDIDMYSDNITYQNNVSRNNNGGAILFMNGSTNGKYTNNISINDGNSDKTNESKTIFYLPTNKDYAPEISNNMIVTGDKTQNIIHSNNDKQKGIYVKVKDNTIISPNPDVTQFTDYAKDAAGNTQINDSQVDYKNNTSNINSKYINNNSTTAGSSADTHSTSQLIDKTAANQETNIKQEIQISSLTDKVSDHDEHIAVIEQHSATQDVVINNHAQALSETINIVNQNTANIVTTEKHVVQNTQDIETLSQTTTQLDRRVTQVEKQSNWQYENMKKYVDNGLSSVRKEINRTAAQTNALAGLFQPYNVGKFNISASLGGYRDENAIAVGSGYRFNEHVAFKTGVTTSTSSSDNLGYNMAVDFEF